MKATQKYVDFTKELIVNDAVSDDKVRYTAVKHKVNKDKSLGWLKKVGIIESMGQGVNRVLVRGQDLTPYVEKLVALASPKKKAEKLDMSLPEKWENTVKEPPYDLFEESDTHAKATPPYHEIMGDWIETAEEAEPDAVIPDDQLEQATEAIDMHAKMLEMINSFMDKVQENTNKQNEYISELEKKVERMEIMFNKELDNALEKVFDAEDELRIARDRDVELDIRIVQLEKRPDPSAEHDKRIASLENRMDMCGEKIERLDDNLEDRMKEQTLIGNKNGMLKALHQLLGELI